MGRITGQGITVELVGKVLTSHDPFGKAIYEEAVETVANVLVGEPTTDEITDTLNLTGKKLAYTLAVPKGDSHIWTNRQIRFFGETFMTIGEPTQGIEALIPLDWNKKVKVERYG